VTADDNVDDDGDDDNAYRKGHTFVTVILKFLLKEFNS
jgi:hypothetical protein